MSSGLTRVPCTVPTCGVKEGCCDEGPILLVIDAKGRERTRPTQPDQVPCTSPHLTQHALPSPIGVHKRKRKSRAGSSGRLVNLLDQISQFAASTGRDVGGDGDHWHTTREHIDDARRGSQLQRTHTHALTEG